MASFPGTSSDLFAVKGQAMPACSKRLSARRAPTPAAGDVGTAAESSHDGNGPEDNGSASVLSIDVCAALVSDPSAAEPAPPARPSGEIAAPPPSRGTAGPFIAAVVAISIAAGVFYVFGPQQRDTAPGGEPPEAAAAESAPIGNVSPAAATPAPDAAPQPASASAAPPPAEPPAAVAKEQKAAGSAKLPSFDLVRVERDGAAVIAGRAAPNAELILLHNGEPIGKVTADWAGEWAFVTDKPLPSDTHKITILVNNPAAEVTLPDGAEPPAQVSDIVNSGPR